MDSSISNHVALRVVLQLLDSSSLSFHASLYPWTHVILSVI